MRKGAVNFVLFPLPPHCFVNEGIGDLGVNVSLAQFRFFFRRKRTASLLHLRYNMMAIETEKN